MTLKKITSYILIIFLAFYINLESFIAFALSPSDIPNKVFFLDAQDTDGDGDSSNEPADNSNITTLVDKFNSNDAFQNDNSKKPIYKSNSINTFPGINFNGNSNLLNLDDNLEISNNANFDEKSYVMLVQTSDDINTFQTIYDEGTKEKGFSVQIENSHIYVGAYNTIDWVSPNKYKIIDLGLIDINNFYTIIFVYDKNNDFLKAYLDGNLKGTLNNISTQTTHGACTFETNFACSMYSDGGTLAIGATKNDTLKLSDNSEIINFEGNFFKGEIGEISSYNYALNDSEVTGLNEYLNSKWIKSINRGKIFHFDAQNIDGDGDSSNEPKKNSTVEDFVDILNGYNATQTIEADKAKYITKSINNFPSLEFDGVSNFYNIANQTDINNGTEYDEKSFSMIIKTSDDVNTLQVLYEQGGGTRGYSFQIENGHLYIGTWNNAEWDIGEQYKFVDLGVIETNKIYNILLVQSSTTVSDFTNTVKGYINGNLAGTITHVDIQKKHGGDIVLGKNSNSRKYDETTIGNGYFFKGNIGEFIGWNKALTDNDILNLNNYLSQRWGLDLIAPKINSSNISNDNIIPVNANIIFNYSDNNGGSGIDTTTNNIVLKKWKGNSWDNTAINITNISNNITSSTYSTNGLDFGKYKVEFDISDNVGNTSDIYEVIFYIDKPEMNISTGEVDVGELNTLSNSLSQEITITIKTIGTPFRLKLKENKKLQNTNSDEINYYNGSTGFGYDKNNDGNLFNIGSDGLIGQEIKNINTNGELNTYTYTVKVGAIINFQQLAGDYSGEIDFEINLDY